MEKSRIEEIKELIQSGFDLELIAFELDIPLEYITQLKKEMEEPRVNEKANKKIDSKSYGRMRHMRERYRKLFFGENKEKSNSKRVKNQEEQPKQLSQKEIEVIQTSIKTIEEKIQTMRNLQKSEKRAIAREILDELKKTFKYQLTIEQVEQLNALMNSNELQNLGTDITDKKYYSINQVKRKLTEQLSQAIKIKLYEVDTIEKLQELERKFIPFIIKGNEILVGEIKREISTKISRIQQQNAIDKLRNDIPTSIETVITELVNGNIDMQKANAIIDEEARKRVDSKPKTRFSLTEEQVRRQLLLQIRTAIIEKSDKYPIKNPEEAMLNIQAICGGELGLNISTVVRNLIARKDFETAKSICSRFSGEKVEAEIKAYIKILRNEIRIAEISELVLIGIKQNEAPEKDGECFELIEKGLEMGNIKLTSISLGKNSDGSKNITLADIWPEQIQR